MHELDQLTGRIAERRDQAPAKLDLIEQLGGHVSEACVDQNREIGGPFGPAIRLVAND